MIKQRAVWSSCFSFSVPKNFRSKLVKAPLASFEVAPKEVVSEVKRQYDAFIQNKAFANAASSVGMAKFRGGSRTASKRVMSAGRSMRSRGQNFRGSALGRGFRGQIRGMTQGVKRGGIAWKNQRSFNRRDRFVNRDSGAGPSSANVSSGTAGGAGENRQ